MSDGLSEDAAGRLVERLRGLAGDELRGAIRYEETAYDLLYIRDDVAETYSEDEIAAAVDDIALEAMGDPERLSGLYRMGQLEATARWFSEGILVHVPADGTTGVAVSFDHTVSAQLGTIVSTAAAFVEAE
ncbi:DUF7522 family protein [Haloarcula litorea]|uniref:DUF7522 family protein n=1 Tax=Haloarcula litorea TaxID=3032579 RepID=UPI0023E8DCDD|nr:hypothetical protein [Halomicroarcula sp. GDY20]